MLSAFRKGKLSDRQENMEDLLTSCVFDAFRYTNRKALLVQWFRCAITSTGSQPLQNLHETARFRFEFWPPLQEGKHNLCEPDLIIEVDQPGARLLICIEAKYQSRKSSEADYDFDALTDQLTLQWGNILERAKRDKREPRLIYLTADVACPTNELDQSIYEFSKKMTNADTQKDIDMKKQMCWLSWRHLTSILHAEVNSLDQPLDDLLDVLENKMRMFFFRGISKIQPSVKIVWSYDAMRKFAWTQSRPINDQIWRFYQ